MGTKGGRDGKKLTKGKKNFCGHLGSGNSTDWEHGIGKKVTTKKRYRLPQGSG